MEFTTFKQKVSNKRPKMKLVHIIWMCLNYAENHPELASKIGCFWYTDDSFLMNTLIFSIFIGRLENTINTYLKAHGFSCIKSTRLMRDAVPVKFNFTSFPNMKNWNKRQCKGFTKKTTEKESRKWHFHHKVTNQVNNEIASGIQNDHDYNDDDDDENSSYFDDDQDVFFQYDINSFNF